MRILLFIAFIVSSFAGFCQQGPVQWSVTSKKIKDNQYELLVTGSVEANWYVYAENGTVPELKAIRVETGNDSILPDGAPQPIVSPVTIQETIFHARMKVYQGRVQLRQRIIVKGKAPSFFKITIYAFAANGETFLPVEATQEIALEDGVSFTGKLFRYPPRFSSIPYYFFSHVNVAVDANNSRPRVSFQLPFMQYKIK